LLLGLKLYRPKMRTRWVIPSSIPTTINFFWYAEKLDRKCTQNERSAGMTGKSKVHCIRFHTNMETKHLKKKLSINSSSEQNKHFSSQSHLYAIK
jgi:hypothetical protein